MHNTLTFGDMFNTAFYTIKKRCIPMFAVAVITRIFAVVLAMVILFVAINSLMDVNIMDLVTVGTRVMGIAIAVIFFTFIFLDVFVTAVTAALCNKKLGKALAAAFSNIHRIFITAIIIAATYFLVILIAYVIIGIYLGQFSPTQLAAMAVNRDIGIIGVALVVACMALVALLLANNMFVLLVPLLVEEIPLLECIDTAAKATFRKKNILKLALFNGMCKLLVIMVYVVIYTLVSRPILLPQEIRLILLIHPVAYALINFVYHLTITYLIVSVTAVFVWVNKSVICSLKPLVFSWGDSKQTSIWGERIAAVAIDIIIQAAVLTGVFYGFIRIFGGGDVSLTGILGIGALPLLAVLAIFVVVIAALNILVKKLAGGKFVGKRLMGIKFHK